MITKFRSEKKELINLQHYLNNLLKLTPEDEKIGIQTDLAYIERDLRTLERLIKTHQ